MKTIRNKERHPADTKPGDVYQIIKGEWAGCLFVATKVHAEGVECDKNLFGSEFSVWLWSEIAYIGKAVVMQEETVVRVPGDMLEEVWDRR